MAIENKKDLIKDAYEEVYCNPKTPFLKKYFPIFFKKEVKFWTLKKLLKSKYCICISKECLVKRIKEYNKQF